MTDSAALHPPESTAPRRRRLWWSIAAVSLLLVLALAPPLLNVNRLRRRIAGGISASLGRPVHLDGVSLHLLPIPGFTLRNLVVSEDPAFGYEPALRAETVEITLRPSSLWRRQVELASIHFVEPSLNLVRNAQGDWNVQGLLMHAAQVDTAPTAQTAPGPAPRFPYIEATGGRVNLKLGDIKQPFALIDADFALWLPEPERWHVRLEGKPVRTDTNAANTGSARLEGQLGRAAAMRDVPVDLRATWHDAPLGEASRLLSGEDAGWRGTLQVDATLAGPLHAARLQTQVHLNDLRRADFVPPRLLDVALECEGALDVETAVVTDPSCMAPTPVPAGKKDAGQVVAVADSVDLSTLHSASPGVAGLRVGMTNVADSWLMDWARMFSQRIPANDAPLGTAAGSVVYTAAAGWQGEFHSDVQGPLPWEPAASGRALPTVSVTAARSGLTLAPLALTVKSPPLVLSGEATMQGYTLRLAGSATTAELTQIRDLLPPLGEGLDTALPELKSDEPRPLKLNLTCTRTWTGKESCINSAEPVRRR